MLITLLWNRLKSLLTILANKAILDLTGVGCLVAAAYLTLGVPAALAVLGVLALTVSFLIERTTPQRR